MFFSTTGVRDCGTAGLREHLFNCPTFYLIIRLLKLLLHFSLRDNGSSRFDLRSGWAGYSAIVPPCKNTHLFYVARSGLNFVVKEMHYFILRKITISYPSLTSTVGRRSTIWACLTTINQSCTMIEEHLPRTANQPL